MQWGPRSRDDYVHALMSKLPRGEIWPRDPDSSLVKTVHGLMGIVARWAQDVARLLIIEAFPPTSYLLLPDWERVLGLPEECLPAAQSLAERRQAVTEKLARRPGKQSRQYFLDIAHQLGYGDVTITEYLPAQCGMTQCGQQHVTNGSLIVQGAGVGTPYIRFVWTVSIPAARLTWFSVGDGGGRAGQDPHLRIQRAVDLECILNKLKPAHTKLVFNYTGV